MVGTSGGSTVKVKLPVPSFPFSSSTVHVMVVNLMDHGPILMGNILSGTTHSQSEKPP